MKVDDLKKGTRILQANGWEADLLDSKKGTTRLAKVYGIYTECGSIYAHNIVKYKDTDGYWKSDVEYSKSQLDCKQLNDSMGF